MYVEVDDINVRVIRSHRRRTLTIEISKGEAKLRCPSAASLAQIERFLFDNRAWLNKHKASLARYEPPKKIASGLVLPIQGREYRLQLLDDQIGKAYFAGATIQIPCRTRRNQSDIAKVKLITLLSAHCIHLLQPEFQRLALLLGVKPKSLKAKNYKARWGCCDSRGNISVNWRLVFAPTSIENYVVAHELAHLLEFNHSAAFWALVESVKPDYKSSRSWLRQHSHELNLI